MEIIRKPGVILRKAAPILDQPEKKKKSGIPARINLKVKINHLPELKTEGKKFALITVRSEIYGYMELFVSAKTYRKCRKTILAAAEDSEHLIVLEVPFDRAQKHGGKIVAKGCGLQVFEKKPPPKKHLH